MKLNNLDLNLLVVFNAIYTEGSLTKAGEIVGITQPAVSSALSKLRDYFDDQLFIRVGQGVKPTAKTENIIIHVRDALSILQRSLEKPDAFDPAVSSRTFRLSLKSIKNNHQQSQGHQSHTTCGWITMGWWMEWMRCRRCLNSGANCGSTRAATWARLTAWTNF